MSGSRLLSLTKVREKSYTEYSIFSRTFMADYEFIQPPKNPPPPPPLPPPPPKPSQPPPPVPGTPSKKQKDKHKLGACKF